MLTYCKDMYRFLYDRDFCLVLLCFDDSEIIKSLIMGLSMDVPSCSLTPESS